MTQESARALAAEIKSCTLCANELAHGVRPVLQIHADASVLIAGQAPGAKVHTTGVPFDDASGNRLREWMGVDKDTFYDARKIAIVPMSFCYPGKGKSGDLPPVPRCAPTWRDRVLATMPNLALTLVIGQYAMDWHLEERAATLTETVKNWASAADDVLPLPHPSPRNNIWLKKNPWFALEVLPVLQRRVSAALLNNG